MYQSEFDEFQKPKKVRPTKVDQLPAYYQDEDDNRLKQAGKKKHGRVMRTITEYGCDDEELDQYKEYIR